MTWPEPCNFWKNMSFNTQCFLYLIECLFGALWAISSVDLLHLVFDWFFFFYWVCLFICLAVNEWSCSSLLIKSNNLSGKLGTIYDESLLLNHRKILLGLFCCCVIWGPLDPMLNDQPEDHFRFCFSSSYIACLKSRLASAFLDDQLEHIFSTACRVCIIGLARAEVVHMTEYVVFSVGVWRSGGKNTKEMPRFPACRLDFGKTPCQV